MCPVCTVSFHIIFLNQVSLKVVLFFLGPFWCELQVWRIALILFLVYVPFHSPVFVVLFDFILFFRYILHTILLAIHKLKIYIQNIYIYSYCSNGIIHCAHVRTRTWTEHDNQYYKDFIFSCSECVWFFSSTLFFSFLFIKYQYTRTYSYRNEKNIPFLQMFVGSCAHININTSAKAPHYKSTGTFCLVAFLYNYKAAHCDKKNRFSFCMPHSHAIYVFALLCFTLLCCARWVG